MACHDLIAQYLGSRKMNAARSLRRLGGPIELIFGPELYFTIIYEFTEGFLKKVKIAIMAAILNPNFT